MKRTAVFTSIFLIIMFSVCICAGSLSSDKASESASGKTGDCIWTLEGTKLTISGNGRMQDYHDAKRPWGEDITELKISKGVTYLGGEAFYYCSSLKKVTIADTVTEIGMAAFMSSGIAEITLPDSVVKMGDYMFDGCHSLKNVTLPGNIPRLGVAFFRDCDSLESIRIPVSVKLIDAVCFEGSSLKDVYYEGSQIQWNEIDMFCTDKELLNADIHFSKDVIKGDADGDGEITVADATIIQQWLANLIEPPAIKLEAAKTTDKPVSVSDATRIQQHLAHLIVLS